MLLSDFTATSLTGVETPLSTYADQVVLVANTASKCGLTPQYEGLERLYREHRDQGLVVLGFPCDQFGHQEPGEAEEISDFCTMNYGVTFPMFAKIEVNGDGDPPALPVAEAGTSRSARRRDQVELHQVPDRPRRQRSRPLRPHHDPRPHRARHQGRPGRLTPPPRKWSAEERDTPRKPRRMDHFRSTPRKAVTGPRRPSGPATAPTRDGVEPRRSAEPPRRGTSGRPTDVPAARRCCG